MPFTEMSNLAEQQPAKAKEFHRLVRGMGRPGERAALGRIEEVVNVDYRPG